MADSQPHITPDELQGQPRRTGRFWFDLAAAILAIFISVVSLIVAFRNGETENAMLAANSWPFLEASLSQELHGNDVVSVVNAGVGPAKIISYEVFFEGKHVDNAPALLQICCGLAADTATIHKQIPHGFGFGKIVGSVIRPGDTAAVLQIRPASEAPMVFDRFNASMLKLSFRACYCSILDQCWTSTLDTLHPTAVQSCPAAGHSFDFGDIGD